MRLTFKSVDCDKAHFPLIMSIAFKQGEKTKILKVKGSLPLDGSIKPSSV